MVSLLDYSLEQFHELFYQYLMGKLDDEQDEVKPLIQAAEETLLLVLNEYFGTNLKSIYELQEENEISELQTKITVHAVLKNLNRDVEPRYTEVLKWYGRFLKSLKQGAPPVSVPGEVHDGTLECNASVSSVKHDDDDYPPDSEGIERQHNLTKKERNPVLRQRCVEYYKNQWNGRIRCICCGFDFGKAYGDIGEGYIEIHHVNPHHNFKGEHMVDPTKDLIPLCSNCHSMIHRVKGQGECMTLEELKDHYKGVKYKN